MEEADEFAEANVGCCQHRKTRSAMCDFKVWSFAVKQVKKKIGLLELGKCKNKRQHSKLYHLKFQIVEYTLKVTKEYFQKILFNKVNRHIYVLYAFFDVRSHRGGAVSEKSLSPES